MLSRQIVRLYDALAKVPVISGKVTGSGREFPYIEEHITVEMAEPRAEAELKKRIKEKESRKDVVLAAMQEVETFISSMPEGEEKQIFELTYLVNMKQKEIAEIVGMERSNISKKISRYLKHSHNSQK